MEPHGHARRQTDAHIDTLYTRKKTHRCFLLQVLEQTVYTQCVCMHMCENADVSPHYLCLCQSQTHISLNCITCPFSVSFYCLFDRLDEVWVSKKVCACVCVCAGTTARQLKSLFCSTVYQRFCQGCVFGSVAMVTDPAGKLQGYPVSISTVYDGTEHGEGGKCRKRVRARQ